MMLCELKSAQLAQLTEQAVLHGSRARTMTKATKLQRMGLQFENELRIIRLRQRKIGCDDHDVPVFVITV
eukprot:3024746-Alexandrium_andersonii.AAC.1